MTNVIILTVSLLSIVPMLPPLILWGSHWVYYDPNKKDEYRRHPPSWCSLLLKKRHFYEMEPDNPQLLKDLRACIKGERPPLNMALGNGILAAIVAYYILIVLSWLGLYLTQEMFSSSKWFIVIHSVVLMLVLSLLVPDLFVRFAHLPGTLFPGDGYKGDIPGIPVCWHIIVSAYLVNVIIYRHPLTHYSLINVVGKLYPDLATPGEFALPLLAFFALSGWGMKAAGPHNLAQRRFVYSSAWYACYFQALVIANNCENIKNILTTS